MANQLTHSILLMAPSGSGKSTFARGALEAYGSGLVVACPLDELDSYYGLTGPSYLSSHFDDSLYLPSLKDGSKATGLKDAVLWLKDRYMEMLADFKAGKAPKYAVLVVDTVSAFGTLATNATLDKYSFDKPPAAMSPDGSAYYTYLRNRQEELMRLARAFRGFGVHLVVLCHVNEKDVGETSVAKVEQGKTRMFVPALPGAFSNALPSFFSTVLYGGIMPGPKNTKVHYIQWKADVNKATKNRFGSLGTQDRLAMPDDPKEAWEKVTTAIEAAADAKLLKED